MKYVKPLFITQFRALKWFLIAYMLLAVCCSYYFFTSLSTVISDIWNYGANELSDMRYKQEIMSLPLETLNFFMVALTFVMALYQQIEANRSGSAQLMASFPPRRGDALRMQLLTGCVTIFAPILVFTAGGLVMIAVNRDILTLGAAISPYVADMSYLTSPGFLLCTSLCIFAIQIFLYTICTCGCALFGNAWISLGFVGVVSLYCFNLYLRFAYIWEELNFVIKDQRILQSLSKLGNYMSVWREWYLPRAENVNLLSVCLLLFSGLCARLLFMMKRRLQLENLGSAFLFKGSRYAVVGCITLWPLMLPFWYLTSWTYYGRIYNTSFPLYFIPAVVVFALGWYFLIKRPAAKSRWSAAICLLIALMIGAPGIAQAETVTIDGRIRWDESKMVRDVSRIETFMNIYQVVADVGGTPDALVYCDVSYGFDNFNYIFDVDGNPVFEEAEQAYLGEYGVFALNLTYQFRFNDQEEDEKEFIQMLTDMGLNKMADEFISRATDSGTIYQDGYILDYIRETETYYTQYETDEGEYNYAEEVFEYIVADLYCDVPYYVKGAEKIDAALLKDVRVQRTNAFSNGMYSTMRYVWHTPRNQGISGINYFQYPLHVILNEDKVERLMLVIPKNQNRTDHGEIRASVLDTLLNAAAENGSVGAADAETAKGEIAELLGKGRTGSGSLGSARWNISGNSDDFMIMVTIE